MCLSHGCNPHLATAFICFVIRPRLLVNVAPPAIQCDQDEQHGVLAKFPLVLITFSFRRICVLCLCAAPEQFISRGLR
jgi:hypothetical protein